MTDSNEPRHRLTYPARPGQVSVTALRVRIATEETGSVNEYLGRLAATVQPPRPVRRMTGPSAARRRFW